MKKNLTQKMNQDKLRNEKILKDLANEIYASACKRSLSRFGVMTVRMKDFMTKEKLTIEMLRDLAAFEGETNDLNEAPASFIEHEIKVIVERITEKGIESV